MTIIDDIIAVRFLSRPHRKILNLRVGSTQLISWLQHKRIEFKEYKHYLIFELPEHYNSLCNIDSELTEVLISYSSMLNERLSTIDMFYQSHTMKFMEPLRSSELLNLFKICKKEFSFSKFSRRK